MVQFTTVSEEQNKQKIVQVTFDEQRETGKNNKKISYTNLVKKVKEFASSHVQFVVTF